jgi:hypothetical protein
MAEIQFERRGTPLWKVLLGLLVGGAAAYGGYELLEGDAPSPSASTTRPLPPAGARPVAAAQHRTGRGRRRRPLRRPPPPPAGAAPAAAAPAAPGAP